MLMGDLPALSEYERRRLENIRKNQQVLEALDIPALPVEASTTKAASATKSAPLATVKRKKPEAVGEPATRRVSARLLSKASGEATTKLGIADELALYRGGSLRPERPEKPPRPPRILGNIPFAPERGATDEFKRLIGSAMASDEPGVRSGRAKTMAGLQGCRSYRIDGEFSVAKVVEERIYSMAVHPSREKILVAAGSKYGALGIWDATAAWAGMADARETFLFKPHTAAISNLRYHPRDPGQLLMTAYDGVVRCLDMRRGEFRELYHAPETQYISAFDTSADGSVIYFTDLDGALTRLDTRAKQTAIDTFQLHEKKAGGFSISPVDNNYCASSSLDDTICVWDLRTLRPFESDMIVRFEYRRAVTSVFFHPTIRDALVSTCYDDSVRIHRGLLTGEGATELRIAHNNQTGRWITPFRAIWDPKCQDARSSHIIVGDMNRGIDVVEMESGAVTNSISELLTAQPAANAIHPSLDLILSGTAGGKCILWKPPSSSS